ncbi:MAG: hypothetical protein HKO01_12685, partial [Flaviramulus sp.]
IWRRNEYEIQHTFLKDKEVANVNLDPNFEFADIERTNNNFPKRETKSEFDTFKDKKKKASD